MKLLIIDDHPMTCAGLQSLLQTCYPAASIAVAYSVEDALTPAADADYVFLDMHFPGLDFPQVLALLGDLMHKAVLISAAPEPGAVALARQRGARGLLPKNADTALVLERFQRIRNGERVFDEGKGPRPSLPVLTGRQYEVFSSLMAGMSNKQIARDLGISEYTVKEHVTAILAACGVKSRLELVLQQRTAGP